jgi:hypothetical protein
MGRMMTLEASMLSVSSKSLKASPTREVVA